MINPEEDGITHINIYSKGKTDLGRMLSNFAKFPIETVDGRKLHEIERGQTMRLIDADKLISDLNNPDLCNVTPRILEIISEQPTVKPSVNPLNILESLLYSLKSKHMAEDMWEPVSPEERKKYCERYGAILKAVNVLEELQSENGGNNND